VESAQAFSAQSERELCLQLLGDRRHGLSPAALANSPLTATTQERR